VTPAGRVVGLRRYPVKSMGAEVLRSARLEPWGLVGDRQRAVVDVETGLVASAKRTQRWGELLRLAPPAGPGADAWLSERLGRPVRLEARGAGEARIEKELPEEDPTGEGVVVGTLGAATPVPPGGAARSYVDFAPVHLVTTAALAAVAALGAGSDPDRWRPNLVLDVGGEGFVEDAWTGRSLRVGEVELRVLTPTPRCLVPGVVAPAVDRLYRRLAEAHRLQIRDLGRLACLGAYATVTTPGDVALGDRVEVGERVEPG
jgi:hypothetical protein